MKKKPNKQKTVVAFLNTHLNRQREIRIHCTYKKRPIQCKNMHDNKCF